MQEITSIISMNGGGISQAIGTGGRDVKKEIGGIMFIKALKALAEDDNTHVICLVSKPPHDEVLMKISEEIKRISKPVVAIFIGANKELISTSGAIPAQSLEEAALLSVALEKQRNLEEVKYNLTERNLAIEQQAKELAQKCNGKYMRGLFSGGTLCDEAQLVSKDIIGNTFSNTPLQPDFKLQNVWKSKGNTILDLGDDEFTSGRPHPMIDFSLRNKRIIEEAEDKDVAVILLDVVLGYGSNLQPANELVPSIRKAKEISKNLQFICSITGTDKDPQNFNLVKSALEKEGVIVMPSNVAAAQLSAYVIQQLNQ
jgi:FdrA protein